MKSYNANMGVGGGGGVTSFFEKKILFENQHKLRYIYVHPTTSCIYKHYT